MVAELFDPLTKGGQNAEIIREPRVFTTLPLNLRPAGGLDGNAITNHRP